MRRGLGVNGPFIATRTVLCEPTGVLWRMRLNKRGWLFAPNPFPLKVYDDGPPTGSPRAGRIRLVVLLQIEVWFRQVYRDDQEGLIEK